MDYRKLIDDNGKKHVWVANKIGVSRSMLSKFLKGERNLNPESLKELHKLLNIN